MFSENCEVKSSKSNSMQMYQPRASFQETIYEMMNEIPSYFYSDRRCSDDTQLEIKRHQNSESHKSSKSAEKKNGLRKKSVSIRKNSLSNSKSEKINFTFKDEISEFEFYLEKYQAYFKAEKENSIIYILGNIILTEFRLIFEYEDKINYLQEDFSPDFYLIPISCIKKYVLDIWTKDNRNINLIVIDADSKLFNSIKSKMHPSLKESFNTFAVSYNWKMKEKDNKMFPGWEIYDLQREFSRQGVDFKKRYRISKVNDNMKLIPTYPKKIVVPHFFTDEDIKECCNFRMRGRIPVLTYQNKRNKCCIWRCAQPKPGLTGQRSKIDEKFLRSIIDYSDKLIIYDARPYLAALGGGFESVDNYFNCDVKFCEIENIHAVRLSLDKLYNLLSQEKLSVNRKYLSELEKTGWLDFISLIIKSSVQISHSIKNNNTVLIHCTDGWDRTSQLATLSQIILDPYYRKIEGIAVLIEKDWLSFGHQFALRNGFCHEETNEDQTAPIFLQWLDCLYQLLSQFPTAFEFNSDFLVYLASNYNNCLYGTFLFNCDKDRELNNAKNETMSIWTYIFQADVLKKFTNPFYDAKIEELTNIKYSHGNLKLWEEYFLKYTKDNSVYNFELNYKNESLTYKNSRRYFEQVKREDIVIIENQNRTIEIYKNTIKDITYLLNETKDKNTLPESLKNYVEKLNTDHEVNGIFEPINVLDNYI